MTGSSAKLLPCGGCPVLSLLARYLDNSMVLARMIGYQVPRCLLGQPCWPDVPSGVVSTGWGATVDFMFKAG